MSMVKLLFGGTVLLVVLLVGISFLPIESCGSDCESGLDKSEWRISDQVHSRHAVAVSTGDGEHRIYYAYLGALAGDEALLNDYLSLFQEMPKERKARILHSLERRDATDREKVLLLKLRDVAEIR